MLSVCYVVKRLYSTHVTRGATRPSPLRCGVSVVRVIYERGGRHARPAAVAQRRRRGDGAPTATYVNICGPVYAGDSPPPRAAIVSHSRRYLGAAEGALQCASPRTPPHQYRYILRVNKLGSPVFCAAGPLLARVMARQSPRPQGVMAPPPPTLHHWVPTLRFTAAWGAPARHSLPLVPHVSRGVIDAFYGDLYIWSTRITSAG